MSILQSCRIASPLPCLGFAYFCPSVWFPIALHYIVITPAVQQNRKRKYGKIHDWREKCAIRRNGRSGLVEWRDANTELLRRRQTAKSKNGKNWNENGNGNATGTKITPPNRPATANSRTSPDGTHSLDERRDGKGATGGAMGGEGSGENRIWQVVGFRRQSPGNYYIERDDFSIGYTRRHVLMSPAMEVTQACLEKECGGGYRLENRLKRGISSSYRSSSPLSSESHR